MHSHLVISALGQDRPGIVNDLSRSVLDTGCNILDSRMTVLGGEFAIILLVSGPWNAVAKLETALASTQERLGLTIISKRTSAREPKRSTLPYAVEVVAMDHPGIVNHLAKFFSERDINIEDLRTDSYAAAHTGAPMFSVHMAVGVPATLHIAELREQFMTLCDEFNLDAMIEPVKG
jgi:glycine cleavage system transcriptional repressor